ncbi:hypothetical protein HYH03_009086 [Edaphochlamys debaryana]|uniref:Calcineurin-like phosphoesterase domain-containing protein n=1 Tax=Edaphochlamys debaryana TaxID=47281 RepID=A0A836BXE9_9CHLO|nr:hypothetical protein HYH03_009086 [Edaphochlamys debaryana]|eukprot:KAG2492671.1 hypothetical protein HYH03_009086 [Edaphochlamys debaryana]
MAPEPAFRELEEDLEDRFFISGVEKAGRLRNTYEHQLRKRRIVVGVVVAVAVAGLIALIVGLAYGLSHRKLRYACPRGYEAERGELVFFVVGDWGRQGSDTQMKTARLMADVSGCMPPKFVISTGDNFYPSGLTSVTDDQFAASFTRVYTAPGLQVPWYAVMGNHDYGDNVDRSLLASGQCLAAPTAPEQCAGKCCFSPWWQVQSQLTARDPRWSASLGEVVTRSFPLGGAAGANSSVDIVFMDTNPYITEYGTREWANFLYGMNYQAANTDALTASLHQQLNASCGRGSRWRLVVGHHPVRSYGNHCTQGDINDCADMFWLRPLLQRYRVAAYINGHDHDQQLIKAPDDPVHYIVSGAGSDVREGEFSDESAVRSRDAPFLSDNQGFVAIALSEGSMTVHYYTVEQSEPAYTRVIPLPAAAPGTCGAASSAAAGGR